MLKTVTSGPGLQSLFAVLCIATVLTIYEIIMFFKIVVPSVDSKIKSGLKQLSKAMKSISSFNFEKQLKVDNKNIIETLQEGKLLDRLMYESFIQNQKVVNTKDALKKILEISEEREDVLIDKINNYTKVTGLFMVVMLCFGLYLINAVLNSRNEIVTRCTWTIVSTTLVLILIFQYLFYIFGNKFKYLGSLGNEELQYYIYSKLT